MRIPRPGRLVAASAAALLGAGGLIALAPSPAAADGPDAASLRTGFELNGGADWTTEAQETEFLAELDARSDRVRVRQIATTRQGRAVRLVTVSASPRGDRQIAAGSSLLFVCSQHGNEPAGREACLRLARDLAAARDPATRELLSHTTVMFVPTANPDGRAANTRTNSDRVDVNRDHLAAASAEGQAVARLFRDLRPDVVHDLHEYGTIPGLYDWNMLLLWPRNLNASQTLRDLGRTLDEDYVAPALTRSGFTSSTYGIRRDGVQIAGDADERILRNLAGLRHSVGLLSESAVDPLTPAEEADRSLLHRRRVDTQLIGANATLRFLRERWLPVALATVDSQVRATVEGALGAGRFFFGGADNQPPAPDQVTDAPPCAYQLSAEQAAAVGPQLDLHGVRVRAEPGGGAVVSMAQPARRVIPLLLDARARFALTEAVPRPCARR